MTERARNRNELRLMTMASRLHHEHDIRQRAIATRLGTSQPRVSRLLAQAEEQGIVRTAVVAPEGIYPEPEEALEDAIRPAGVPRRGAPRCARWSGLSTRCRSSVTPVVEMLGDLGPLSGSRTRLPWLTCGVGLRARTR
jgi:hypothetical protein